jgi:UDP-N-acetylmuramoyl-L-alanyl-D-glutamate--2,6-diaminopimelate ligase
MGKQAVRLCDLLPGATHDERAIAGVALDSRAVAPGFAFFAVSGAKADGHEFIDSAIAQGAVAIISDRPLAHFSHPTVAYVHVPHCRLAAAQAAARFYPQQPAIMVAVTGTSGKSSVADFTRQIFEFCGHKAASLGTLGVIAHGQASYGSLTTPDPMALHRSLANLAASGITHGVMEASSHGLDQYRLDGVRLKAAAFTNLGRDHLDYHPDLEAYFAAKMRLFRDLLPREAPAIINTDNEWSERALAIARASGHPILTVGEAGQSIRLVNVVPHGFAQTLTLRTARGERRLQFPLAGRFQIANALVAAGLALAVGDDEEAVLSALETLRGVPGRLEPIGTVNGALAVVDYAHKPEALAHALDALRPFAKGRLLCVFGCGGNRDAGKRPLMGAIAAAKADYVIVTDDNPRHENPTAIRQAILAAAPGAVEIADRAEAISTAIQIAQPGDIVLIAGKGHETGQIIGDQILPFSDAECVAKALAEKERQN